MRLEVLTAVERLLVQEDVAWVRVVLADGSPLSIYPGHVPLLAETRAGLLRYEAVGGEGDVTISRGILRVNKESVTLLTAGRLADDEGSHSPDTETERFPRLVARLSEERRRPGTDG